MVGGELVDAAPELFRGKGGVYGVEGLFDFLGSCKLGLFSNIIYRREFCMTWRGQGERKEGCTSKAKTNSASRSSGWLPALSRPT